MRLRNRSLLRVLMVSFALSGTSLYAIACDNDNDADDVADEIGDAAEDAAEDVEDAVEDATD